MTALSIHLPEKLALASTKTAKKLGISRSEFIRLAIKHEVERIEKQNALEMMVGGFNAMKKSESYKKESDEIESGFDEDLPEEENDWWE